MSKFARISVLFYASVSILSFCLANSASGVDYGTIHPGQTRSGEITIPSPNDSFTFYGGEGNTVIITMSVTSGEI